MEDSLKNEENMKISGGSGKVRLCCGKVGEICQMREKMTCEEALQICKSKQGSTNLRL